MLCISTNEWVLRMPFAGRNRLSNAKTTFSVIKQWWQGQFSSQAPTVEQNISYVPGSNFAQDYHIGCSKTKNNF